MLKEISITDIEKIYIGQAEDAEKGTGCTVIVCPEGMAAGLDVRGGGPASRESELLKPLAAAELIHAVVLGGGSAFGLDAAGGVMEYLRSKDIGFDVGFTRVPLVCQSDIFDLVAGDPNAYPDHRMGAEAAKKALEGGNYKDGNYGGGCGATVGKLGGLETCMKSGIGSYAVQIGELKVGALVVVNALGDIYDYRTNEKIAGLLNPGIKSFASSEELMYSRIEAVENRFTDNFAGNTTIGVVITNGQFTKSKLCKIAAMAHNGYAKSICPVHTTADGDSIYAASVGNINADQDVVGTLAARVMSEAIIRAINSADSAYGFVSAKDLMK